MSCQFCATEIYVTRRKMCVMAASEHTTTGPDGRRRREIIIARLDRPCYLHAVLSSSVRPIPAKGTCSAGSSVTSSTRHRSRARHINFISTTSSAVYIGIFDGCCGCWRPDRIGCGLHSCRLYSSQTLHNARLHNKAYPV